MSLIYDDALVRRASEARTRCYVARYEPVAACQRPPRTLQILREGPLTAIRWEGLDRVFDSGAESVDALAALLDRLLQEDRRPAVDTLPVEGQVALHDLLHARGYRVARSQALLVADPRGAEREPVAGVEIAEVDDADSAAYAELIETYARGQEWKEEEDDEEPLETWLGWVALQYRGPRWVRYVARVDGVSAGVGLLHLGDGLAYLANAATDPVYRGRGIQRALLHARLERAAAEGYELVASDTTVHSTSMRNMQRAGLTLAANMPQWRPA